ncbi:MAG: site-2 protease family protein [Saprospiraceae bacterium]|nr:site-2 protease family protein [Saprospiraceae bacterium]
MGRSLYIGTYLGIPVKVHWSFGLILLLIGYIIYDEGFNFQESAALILYVFSLFLCVILHEYGHALAARRYGVGTEDIILSPIGGLARLHRIPENPKQELVIAIAGPLVNLIIALILFLIILIVGQFELTQQESMTMLIHPIGFIQMVLLLNIVLFVFNLIPAFPMDGGRILRAGLSLKLDRLKATRIASITGRFLSVVFMVVGVYYSHYALIFIGLFVYIMAFKEYQYLKMKKMHELQQAQLIDINYSTTEEE